MATRGLHHPDLAAGHRDGKRPETALHRGLGGPVEGETEDHPAIHLHLGEAPAPGVGGEIELACDRRAEEQADEQPVRRPGRDEPAAPPLHGPSAPPRPTVEWRPPRGARRAASRSGAPHHRAGAFPRRRLVQPPRSPRSSTPRNRAGASSPGAIKARRPGARSPVAARRATRSVVGWAWSSPTWRGVRLAPPSRGGTPRSPASARRLAEGRSGSWMGLLRMAVLASPIRRSAGCRRHAPDRPSSPPQR